MAGKPIGRPRKPVQLAGLLEQTAPMSSGQGGYEQNNVTLPPVISETGPGYGDENVMTLAAAQSVMRNDLVDASTKRAYQDLLKNAMGRHHTPGATTYVDNRKISLPSEVRDVPNTLESDESGLIMARRILKALLGIDLFNEARLCARGRGFKTQVGTKTATWLSQLLALELESKDTLQLAQDIEPYTEDMDGNEASIVGKATVAIFGPISAQKLSKEAHLNQCSVREVLLVLVKRILLKQAKARHALPYDVDNDEAENSLANV
jgi:hypothetical protein